MARSYFLALLAEGLGKIGQIQEALKVLSEALLLVENNQERVYAPELYRLKGELTLKQMGMSKARSGANPHHDDLFRQAIALAHRQGARSLELRAILSQSLLWKQQGRKMEARKKLRKIFDTFDEGLNTADLVAAKTLLDELG